MARVTLFDQASISPYSRFFWLENQVTVVGHGLQPDDYITFEAVETNAAPMAKNCGCDFVPAGAISLNSILELTCTACNGVVSPVVLTAANPVVVLDHPQGFYLRAVYHGTGLATGEVIVRATDTDTRDLTDALRGCPERCPDYVGTLCITPGTRAFGVNDPRDPEATVPILREGNIVGYIYPTPRSHAPIPVTEDPCQPCDGNTVGAIIGYAMPWDGPETECLCLCYECQDISWEQVGDAYCRNGTLWVDEISNCGRTRERDTGEACCVDTTWTQVGAPECREDDFWWVIEQSNCGNTRERNTGIPCGVAPCTPNWTSTFECRANGRRYQVFVDQNACEPSYEVDVGPVIWTTIRTFCGVNGFYVNEQVNQCNHIRHEETSTPCEEPCDANTWTPTGQFRCDGSGAPEREERNDCGDTRWVPVTPEYEDSTIRRCDFEGSGRIEVWQNEIHGCEGQWRDDGPVVWTPVNPPEFQCGPTTHQQRMENQCGDRRWEIIGPVVWTPTGEERCVGEFVQLRETNQCGDSRWTHEKNIVWTPTGEEQCVDGFVQVRETNQCGDTRWRVTTTPCGQPIPPDFEGVAGCCFEGAGWPAASVEFVLNGNGTTELRRSCAPNLTHTWLPAGSSVTDYEFRFEVFPGSDRGWAAGNVPYSTSVSCNVGGSPQLDSRTITMYWRYAGDTDPTGSMVFTAVLEAGCGRECIDNG